MTVWLLVSGLGATALLVGAEIGCRWWLRRRTGYYLWPPGIRLEFRLDPEVFPELERRVRFEINADSERGSEVRGAEAGLYRVLVAGGSPVECTALDQPTSWPGALERLLGVPDALHTLGARRVHVGSIGRSGVGSAELDLIFDRVLSRYRRLAAIVIMVGGNDVFHWLEHGAPLSLPASFLPISTLFAWNPDKAFGWKPRTWAVSEVIRRLRHAWLRPLHVVERAGASFARARKMRAAAQELRTTVPDPAVMLDRFEHHFRRLIRTAEAHAQRVLVVRQPWFEKVYTAEEAAHIWHGGLGDPSKQTLTVYYSMEVLNRLMGLVDAQAARVAEELGIEHLDIRPVLEPSLEHYYDFVHYTPAGAAVVAHAVAAALLGRPALAEQSLQPAHASVSSAVAGFRGVLSGSPDRL